MEIASVILFGIVVSIFTYNIVVSSGERLSRFWCRRWELNLIPRWLRMRSALRVSLLVTVMGLPVGVVYSAISICLAPFPYGLLVMAGALVMFVFPLMVLSLSTRPSLVKLEQLFSMEAGKNVAGVLSARVAEQLLLEAAAVGGHITLAAIVGMRRLGTPACVEALKELVKTGTPQVQAAAAEVLAGWERYLQGTGVQDIQFVEAMFEAYELALGNGKRKVEDNGPGVRYNMATVPSMATMALAKEKDQAPGLLAHLPEIEADIDGLIDTQIALKLAYPAVWCNRCNARGEEVQRYGWRWVACTNCKGDADMLPHIGTVVGVLGPLVPSEDAAREYRISIWDGVQKRPVSAQIDVLEIVGGGEVDYDWAVSAVVEKMRNYGQGSVPVVLVGEPPLAANSLALLRAYDAGFKGDGREPEAKLR